MKKNNIDLLKLYFQKDQPGIIIINKISEEINSFYNYLIHYYIQKNRINLIKNELKSNFNDLFNYKEIHLFTDCNATDIRKILSNKLNAIIFTNYTNYKKFSSKNNFNSYYFENDIKVFINNELCIDKEELISYCISNPQFIYSETSKYLINKNYNKDITDRKKLNSIYEIRKNIFDLKKFKNNAREIYNEIKKETLLKKINFLA